MCALLRQNPPALLHCVVPNFTTSNTLGRLPYPSRARNSTRVHCVRGLSKGLCTEPPKINPRRGSRSVALGDEAGPSLLFLRARSLFFLLLVPVHRSLKRSNRSRKASTGRWSRLRSSNKHQIVAALGYCTYPIAYLFLHPSKAFNLSLQTTGRIKLPLRPKLPSDAATLHAPARVSRRPAFATRQYIPGLFFNCRLLACKAYRPCRHHLHWLPCTTRQPLPLVTQTCSALVPMLHFMASRRDPGLCLGNASCLEARTTSTSKVSAGLLPQQVWRQICLQTSGSTMKQGE